MSVLKYVNYCGLSVIGCCFRSRRGFIPGPVSSNGSTKDTEQKEEQRVVLDTSAMGWSMLYVLSFHFISHL